MKTTMTISTLLMASMLVLSGCAADDDDEDIMGELHVSVMFMNNYVVTDDDASMIMAYAWDMANWSGGPLGASTSNAVDGMFTGVSVDPNAPDTLAVMMHEVMLKNLPVGTYYVGVFESSQMNYDATQATLIGYYNSDDATTMSTMMAGSATSVTISTTTPVELETMMAMPMMGGM